MKNGVSAGQEDALHHAAGALNSGALGATRLRVVRVPADARDSVAATYRASPAVESVSFERAVHASWTPNDPEAADQWALAAVGAPAAWDVTAHGTTSAPVAVLDSGIAADHPDLAGRVARSTDFTGSGTGDHFGHGTAVAGVIAAGLNNGLGIAGLSTAPLLDAKVLDNAGAGHESDLINAIIWAADQGARVINMSVATQGSCDAALQSAIDYAWQHGAVLVAAAGNDGAVSAEAPAVCAHVVAVGATDRSGARASFSNYGANVALGAPGSDVLTTGLNGTYAGVSGTSVAAAHVSAAASLLWATRYGADNRAVVDRLLSTAAPSAEWRSGRLDLAAAVGATSVGLATTVPTMASATPVPTASATPVPTASSTPAPIASATAVPPASATALPTAPATAVPSASSTPASMVSATPVATASATPVPTASATGLPTAPATAVPTVSSSPAPIVSPTPVPTASAATPVPTASATPLPTASATPVSASSATAVPTPSPTVTPSVTGTVTAALTPAADAATVAPSVTGTVTAALTPAADAATVTPSVTVTVTPTVTPSPTPDVASTVTPTPAALGAELLADNSLLVPLAVAPSITAAASVTLSTGMNPLAGTSASGSATATISSSSSSWHLKAALGAALGYTIQASCNGGATVALSTTATVVCGGNSGPNVSVPITYTVPATWTVAAGTAGPVDITWTVVQP